MPLAKADLHTFGPRWPKLRIETCAKVLDYIANEATPFESEPLAHLARDNQLGVYRHTGFWHPMDTLRYGFSLMYCMTTSLGNGGLGLGTQGLPESKMRALCLEAGFREVRVAPLDDPFPTLYEAIP